MHHPEDGWLVAAFTGAMTLTSNLVWPGDYTEVPIGNVLNATQSFSALQNTPPVLVPARYYTHVRVLTTK